MYINLALAIAFAFDNQRIREHYTDNHNRQLVCRECPHTGRHFAVNVLCPLRAALTWWNLSICDTRACYFCCSLGHSATGPLAHRKVIFPNLVIIGWQNNNGNGSRATFVASDEDMIDITTSGGGERTTRLQEEDDGTSHCKFLYH